MDLSHIVRRLAEAIPAIDMGTTSVHGNSKTGEIYDPGVPSMPEECLRDEFIEWWLAAHGDDFSPPGACTDEQPYEGTSGRCDLILSSQGGTWPSSPEWAIELKRVQLVGNNGNNNDYGLAKVLSPYLKDRSMLHDAERLRGAWPGSRVAVVVYGFEYGRESLQEAARRHPDAHTQLKNLRKVCNRNDPVNLEYGIYPMVEVADAYFTSRRLVLDVTEARFTGAWRHPCGGNGRVVGWEISRPA